MTGLPFFLGAFAAAPREGKSSSSSPFFLRGWPRPGKARSAFLPAPKEVLVSSSSAWRWVRVVGGVSQFLRCGDKIYMRSGGTAAATRARDASHATDSRASRRLCVIARGAKTRKRGRDVARRRRSRRDARFPASPTAAARAGVRASFSHVGGSVRSGQRRPRTRAGISPGRPRLRKRPMRT